MSGLQKSELFIYKKDAICFTEIFSSSGGGMMWQRAINADFVMR